MTTPAYQPHAQGSLTSATTGPNVPVNAQINDNALADEAALWGMLGWAEVIAYSAGKIALIQMVRGVYRVRIDFAYVAAGPATGKVDYETHYWSNDSGSSYTLRTDTGITLGRYTYSYDGSGNGTGGTWS